MPKAIKKQRKDAWKLGQRFAPSGSKFDTRNIWLGKQRQNNRVNFALPDGKSDGNWSHTTTSTREPNSPASSASYAVERESMAEESSDEEDPVPDRTDRRSNIFGLGGLQVKPREDNNLLAAWKKSLAHLSSDSTNDDEPSDFVFISHGSALMQPRPVAMRWVGRLSGRLSPSEGDQLAAGKKLMPKRNGLFGAEKRAFEIEVVQTPRTWAVGVTNWEPRREIPSTIEELNGTSVLFGYEGGCSTFCHGEETCEDIRWKAEDCEVGDRIGIIVTKEEVCLLINGTVQKEVIRAKMGDYVYPLVFLASPGEVCFLSKPSTPRSDGCEQQ